MSYSILLDTMKNSSYHYHYEAGCPVQATVDVMGGRWKPSLLYWLLDGTKRFNELRRLMPETTQRMLTLQLRELEKNGIVARKVYAEVPPKVEYSLTPLGRSLEPIIAQMGAWCRDYLADHLGIEDSQAPR